MQGIILRTHRGGPQPWPEFLSRRRPRISRKHRDAATATLRKLGHQAVLLEDLTADPHKAPLDQSRALIDSCEAFIGLLAWRYGLRA